MKKIFEEEAKSLKSQSASLKTIISTLPAPKKYEDAASALTAAVVLGEKLVGRLEKATEAAESVMARLLAERAEFRVQEDLRDQAELQQYRLGQNRQQQRFRDVSPQRGDYRRDTASRFDSSPREKRADKRERERDYPHQERERDHHQDRGQDVYGTRNRSHEYHRDDEGRYQDREHDEQGWNSGVEGGTGGAAPASPPVLGGHGGRGGRDGGRGGGRGRIGTVREDGLLASKRQPRGVGGLYSS